MKSSIKNILSTAFIATVFLTGCKKGPDMPMATLDLGIESIIAPYMGAEYTLSVNSNTSWEVVSSDETWTSFSTAEFVGSTELTVQVGGNDGDERTAVITVRSKDGGLVRELPVVQAGVSSEGYISISALRELEGDGDYTITGNDARIKGFVVTDAVSGNWFENSFAIEDSFSDVNSGITVSVTGDYSAIEFGNEISIPLEGAVLGRNDSGYLTLTVAGEPQLTETTPVEVKPLTVDHAAMQTGDYESMYVSLNDFQVVQESIGGTWAVSPKFENADGDRIVLPVSENAVFASVSYNEGVGTICGIAGPAGTEPELRPVNLEGIDLSVMRIGVKPGIRQLPYVFPFYCSEQANETPKYLRYNKLSYNASTHLVKGVVAEDLDETVGAYLEMTAYGKEAGNIYNGGTNYWAEIGGHDNINTSGFVSVDNGKTPIPEECGFWLTVPLQMDMPEDFNITFGLGSAGEWALKNWDVSYSADKQDWTVAGSIAIDRVITGGTCYLYHSVPVHLESPILSGNNLYIKFTPRGSEGVGGATTADGHGASCQIRLHSAIIFSTEVEGDTYVPAGAVYFQPFDKLTAGTDFFIGDRLAALANYCADEISSWTEEQRNGMTGEKVMERPGYAQIGFVETETTNRAEYVNETGYLTTPALGVSGDITLSFKAAAYRSPAIRSGNTATSDVASPDITEAVVEVIGGGTINGSTTATVTGLPTDSFKTFTLNITGATAGTQIRFTSAPAQGQFSRWFIDDILVTK